MHTRCSRPYRIKKRLSADRRCEAEDCFSKSAVEAATAAEFNSRVQGSKPPEAVWMSPAPLSIAQKQTWSLRKLNSPTQPITCTGYSPCSKTVRHRRPGRLANTAVLTAQGNYDQALAALREAEARMKQSVLHRVEADAAATESTARLGQAIHNVDTLDTLCRKDPGGRRESNKRA